MTERITEQSFTLNSNYRMPVIGLGTWRLSGSKCQDTVKAALNLGYKHIDTAQLYDNERQIGRAIKEFDRKQLFITSKVAQSQLYYDQVLKACGQSLDKLGTDYLDMYLIHWPNDSIAISETMQAMGELVNRNMVRSIGLSNFNVARLRDAVQASPVPVCNDQVEYHPLTHRRELPEFCRQNGITITAYSPLARGSVAKIPQLQQIAQQHGKTPAQISLKWLIQKGIAAIPKASSVEHLKENIDLDDLELTAREINLIDTIEVEQRFIDHSYT